MATKIFVNLPMRDLRRSVDFFTGLGFRFNPQFTGETAACKFQEFTPKPIADARKTTEAVLALSLGNRGAVDEMARKAVAPGGTTYALSKDHGFMYQHGFQDPDGPIRGYQRAYELYCGDLEVATEVARARA